MQRARMLVAVGIAMSLAGPPAAWSDEDVVFEARAVRCGDTLTTHTRLTHDLSCPGTDAPALRVAGPGMILDLGGHTVRRAGRGRGRSDGILVVASSTVRNGTIQGFQLGYVVDSDATHSPDHVRMYQLDFIDNGAAIYNRGGSTEFSLSDSRLIGNGVGFSSEPDASSGSFEVRSTLFQGNQTALLVNNHSADVVDSTFRSNGTVALCLYGNLAFTSSRLVRNTAVGDIRLGEFGYGFCGVVSFADTVIAHNGAFAPQDHPDWAPFNLVVRDSRVFNNGEGLRVRARNADIRDTLWWGNAGGLTLAEPPEYLLPALTGTIRGNGFLFNQGDGLRVETPSTLTVSRNIAIGNTGWGLYVPGVIDGGGNAARDNAAGSCEGVVCAPARFTPLLSADNTRGDAAGE